MPKLSSAFAASALLLAMSAPSFAADLDSSTSQHRSTTIQNREQSNDGVSTSSGAKTEMQDKTNLDTSSSMNKSTQDRAVDRPQSAQMPDQDRDMSGPGRSSTAPGHEMQEHGSLPGSPGASGYAPGHR